MIQPQKKVIVCHKHHGAQEQFATSILQIAGLIVFVIIIANTWEFILIGAFGLVVTRLFLSRN